MSWFEGFETRSVGVNGVEIFVRAPHSPQGARPALLLLHGFPQSHVMWHRVAQQLARDFHVVMPDLRGYGDSAKPAGLADHSNYSKRTLAQDMVDLMDALGVAQFFLCGHDRGGRVAHRLAVDHPQRVQKLCVIDIAPTLDMYNGTGMSAARPPEGARTAAHQGEGTPANAPYMEFARAYYHWFHLIQPVPLPETMIGGNAQAYLHAKLGGWGADGLGYIEPHALAEYERCFCKAPAIHGACEDYRASAGIDLDHDRESRARGDTIACDTLVLWGERGVVNRLFNPLELWRAQCAATVTGLCLPAGHFIPEELPRETAAALREFFLPGR